MAARRRVLVLDRFGDAVLEVIGEVRVGSEAARRIDEVKALLARHVKHMGPVTLAPTAWVIRGGQLTELHDPEAGMLAGLVPPAGREDDMAIIVGRQ
jgi:hypothetical protein